MVIDPLSVTAFDVETGGEFWISGPRKDGQDRLYPESTQAVEVDADVAVGRYAGRTDDVHQAKGHHCQEEVHR